MHNSWLLDNETISVQLGNISTRIRQGDFVDFIGIQPNLAFTALEYGRREALLQTERNCNEKLAKAAHQSKQPAVQGKSSWLECYQEQHVGASPQSITMA